jgi:hypothetical protein
MKNETKKSKFQRRESLRFMSYGGVRAFRRGNEILKQALREWVIRHALRMPLDAHDPV